MPTILLVLFFLLTLSYSLRVFWLGFPFLVHNKSFGALTTYQSLCSSVVIKANAVPDLVMLHFFQIISFHNHLTQRMQPCYKAQTGPTGSRKSARFLSMRLPESETQALKLWAWATGPGPVRGAWVHRLCAGLSERYLGLFLFFFFLA